MIAQKYGFSKVDSEKVARIVQYADIVKEFSQATNTSTLETTDRGLKLEGNGKADLLNQASFYLSEGNTFELAKILYTAKGSGKENIIDEVINKVNQILEEGIKNKKEQTTILPQTTQADIIQSAKQYGRQERIIDDNGKEYVVYIVHVDDIPHFASFTHCTSPGLSNTKKSVFNNEFLFKDYFSTPLNDKVISTSYIGDSKHLG
jgi:hypothetical protein